MSLPKKQTAKHCNKTSVPVWPAEHIVERVSQTGGLTIHPATGKEPTQGFIISEEGDYPIIPAHEFFNHKGMDPVINFIRAHKDWFTNPDNYLGFWHDKSNDTVTVNKVTIVRGKEEALVTGTKRKQKAIWDANEQKEICLKSN